MTRTVASPTVPGGVVAAIETSSRTTTLVAAWSPKNTSAGSRKLDPRIKTRVPPVSAPALGLTTLMAGAGTIGPKPASGRLSTTPESGGATPASADGPGGRASPSPHAVIAATRHAAVNDGARGAVYFIGLPPAAPSRGPASLIVPLPGSFGRVLDTDGASVDPERSPNFTTEEKPVSAWSTHFKVIGRQWARGEGVTRVAPAIERKALQAQIQRNLQRHDLADRPRTGLDLGGVQHDRAILDPPEHTGRSLHDPEP